MSSSDICCENILNKNIFYRTLLSLLTVRNKDSGRSALEERLTMVTLRPCPSFTSRLIPGPSSWSRMSVNKDGLCCRGVEMVFAMLCRLTLATRSSNDPEGVWRRVSLSSFACWHLSAASISRVHRIFCSRPRPQQSGLYMSLSANDDVNVCATAAVRGG